MKTKFEVLQPTYVLGLRRTLCEVEILEGDWLPVLSNSHDQGNLHLGVLTATVQDSFDEVAVEVAEEIEAPVEDLVEAQVEEAPVVPEVSVEAPVQKPPKAKNGAKGVEKAPVALEAVEEPVVVSDLDEPAK